jgi:hypothetical protein
MRVTAGPRADAPVFRNSTGKCLMRAAMDAAPARKTVLKPSCAVEKEHFGDRRKV